MKNVIASRSNAVLGLALAVSMAIAPVRGGDPPSTGGDDQWPQFRGPGGRGIATTTAAAPLRWSPTENIVWRVEIEGRGHSSPVVWNDLVFLTAAVEGEVVPGAKAPYHFRKGRDFVHPDSVGADHRHRLEVIAIDAKTGAVRWSRTAYEGLVYDDRHRVGSYASPTCATDGKTLIAYFGSEGVFAFDFAGTQLWTRDVGDIKSFGMGVGSSPILVGNLVIVQADAEDGTDSYLIALDSRNGNEVWKTSRRPVQMSWTTPTLAAAPDGSTQLLTNGFELIAGYDPASGRELWRAGGMDSNAVQMPLAANGLAIFCAGHPRKITMAVRLGASGDLTGSENIAWTYPKGTGYIPTNLLYEGYLYLTNDSGTLTCLDPATGAVVYEGGRVEAPGNVMASLLGVDGKILMVNRDGDATFVKAGPVHEVIATSSIEEPVYATPAITAGRIYLRGELHLFAIGSN
ncbi:MAG TPA: PQQ-binding-like beta-propeller repeat protein [Thermoanaerobaculia bacterium]|nr:PQQ-binding-like beta-propeller repeat protein [Thermoanaerobaculia bacterium]